VKISLPGPVRLQDRAELNMILWQLPDANKTSATQIMGINVYATDETAVPGTDQPRSHYLFELRDIEFAIRYLLRICRSQTPGNLNDTTLRAVIAVAIMRTHVTGLCETTNVAARLFLGPGFAPPRRHKRFVGCIGTGPLADYGSLREFVNSLGRSHSCLPTPQVLLQILGATNVSRFQPPSARLRWNIGQAKLL
jgi:hypothetical protein